jgi:glycosyltransferase involved in cell wall biosynthesis
MYKPFFSIIIPTTGRPRLVRDAVASVVGQDWKDYELILSNNGANVEVRGFFSQFRNKVNFRYFEFETVLEMDEHWEFLSKSALGNYQIVLTDRMVLKKGALAKIARLHQEMPGASNIISWAWDLFDEQTGWFQRHSGVEPEPLPVLKSSNETLRQQFAMHRYSYELPRGLNSSVSSDFISTIRRKFGRAFSKHNPDFTFAYRCLCSEERFLNMDESLMISQGLGQSNGGNYYSGDVSKWLHDAEKTLSLVPSKAPLVENSIYQDFLSVMKEAGNLDLFNSFDRVLYYRRCFNEISAKRTAGFMPCDEVDELERIVRIALEEEDSDVREEVEEELKNSESAQIQPEKSSSEIFVKLKRKWFDLRNRSVFLPHATERFSTVLSAAGFAPFLRRRQHLAGMFRMGV